MITIKGYEIAGRMPVFTTENRALVRSGVKTQTRRVMKPQPPEDETFWGPELYSPIVIDRHGEPQPGKEIFGIYGEDWGIKCRYGKVGDIRVLPEPLEQLGPFVWYKDTQTEYRDSVGERAVWQWKRDTLSSMFMPTWAGRTLVHYTDIRVERLQDISKADAIAEGIQLHGITRYEGEARNAFAKLWNSNIKKHLWSDNDWVWVIEWELI